MKLTHAKHGQRALEVLGCKDVARHSLSSNHMLSGTSERGEAMFITTLEELEAAILRLARERAGR